MLLTILYCYNSVSPFTFIHLLFTLPGHTPRLPGPVPGQAWAILECSRTGLGLATPLVGDLNETGTGTGIRLVHKWSGMETCRHERSIIHVPHLIYVYTCTCMHAAVGD